MENRDTTKRYALSWNRYRMELGERTRVMGVVNVTPDSFSDGGAFYSHDRAVAQGMKLAEEGADIIDIGGESTRPFSDPVPAEEEIRRVIPVIEGLASRVDIPISIDTTKAEVAARAVEAGASVINDISALRTDPELGAVAAEYGLPIILMHMKGTPKNMQVEPVYEDVVREVCDFLKDAAERAVQSGVPRSQILIDPGIGFGKTFAHNLTLIRKLRAFAELDMPLVVGTSRKAFIRALLKSPDEKDLDPLSPVVETGTQATVAASAMNGAHIVRVHNVAGTRATVRLIDAIRNAENH